MKEHVENIVYRIKDAKDNLEMAIEAIERLSERIERLEKSINVQS